MISQIPSLLLLTSGVLGGVLDPRGQYHHNHHKWDCSDESSSTTAPALGSTSTSTTAPALASTSTPTTASVLASTSSSTTSSPTTTSSPATTSSSTTSTTSSPTTTPTTTTADVGHAGGGEKYPVPVSSPPTSTTSTAAPTASVEAAGSSGGSFNVATYYGGPDMPFTVSQDQAPKMDGTDYVDLHNQYRALHGVPPLVANDTLQGIVSNYVESCPMDDLKNAPDIGSNWLIGPSTAPADNLWWWYNERANFTALSDDFTTLFTVDFTPVNTPAGPVSHPMTGHFTAMVWKDTQATACAIKSCPQSDDPEANILVCIYWPAGNLEDYNGMLDYRGEVLKPSH